MASHDVKQLGNQEPNENVEQIGAFKEHCT